MNTFVTDPDFALAARSLSRGHLGKRRLEVWQMLRALTGQTRGWANHPAVVAWTGHARALAGFGLACHTEWIARGYVDTTRGRLADLAATLPDTRGRRGGSGTRHTRRTCGRCWSARTRRGTARSGRMSRPSTARSGGRHRFLLLTNWLRSGMCHARGTSTWRTTTRRTVTHAPTPSW